MTVYERVACDIKDGSTQVVSEGAPGACAICGAHRFLRYGCCLHCARTTQIDDPRLEGYPREGDKPREIVSHEVPTDWCPACEAKIERATMIDGEGPPTPGDISICFACGAFNEFTAQLLLIPLRPETRRQIPIDQMAMMLRAQVKIRQRSARGR